MLESIGRFFLALHFQYAELFLTALLPMSLTVIVHGQGMGLVVHYWKRFRSRFSGNPHSTAFLLITVIAIMMAAHYVEISLWALFYFSTDMLSDFRSAMSFSVSSYTTLGSSIILPARWQGLDGLEAMAGMLMFGWSTAILVSIVQKIHNIDA
jgi:hypothetical protein